MENRDSTTGAQSRQPQGELSRSGSAYPVRYNPLHEMQEQIRRMDALFNRVFGYEPFARPLRDEFQQLERSEPDVDIYESDTEYIVHAALPGVDPQDIRLETTEDTLILTGQRRPPFEVNCNTMNTNGDNTINSIDGRMEPQQRTEQQAPQGSRPPSGQQQPQSTTPQSKQTGGPNAALLPTGASSAAATAEPFPGTSGPPAPHTQHRRSRTSNQMNFRLVYTLPTPINSENARANFRHGMLELHLPKLQSVTARTIPITIDSGKAAETSTRTQQYAPATAQTSANSGTHEGNPANKIGATFTPSPGEDHTMQAQSIRDRTEHRTGRDESPVASGQINPISSTPPTEANAETKSPSEANRRA
jgi:HSP20 family molecular chaperone IbpA